MKCTWQFKTKVVYVLLTLVSLGGNYFMQLLMLTSTNVSAIYFKADNF